MKNEHMSSADRTTTIGVRGLLGAVGGLCVLASGAAAQPGTPVYTRTIEDCTTCDNIVHSDDGRRWFVDPGCDTYQIDVYERPTTQSYESTGGRFAAAECFEYLDLSRARVGSDDRYLYVALDMFGRDHRTGDEDIAKGMIERYGFRLSTDPDGRYGYLFVSDQPEVKNEPNTRFGPLGCFGYVDTDGDVGGADRDGPSGLTVTKSDNPDEEDGLNGYDTPIIADGKINENRTVLWVRLAPSDDTVVELALDYVALGFTKRQIDNLPYLEFEAVKGGPKDPQNSLWNDKYTKEEAGSPNPGRNGDESEFGTGGLENVYEADTLRGGAADDCGADFNGDGRLDTQDVLAFLNAFASGDGRADFDGNGRVDSRDVIAFLNAFNAGC